MRCARENDFEMQRDNEKKRLHTVVCVLLHARHSTIDYLEGKERENHVGMPVALNHGYAMVLLPYADIDIYYYA